VFFLIVHSSFIAYLLIYALIPYKILKRGKVKPNILLSFYFILTILAYIFNFIYFSIENHLLYQAFSTLSWFLRYFSLIFLTFFVLYIYLEGNLKKELIIGVMGLYAIILGILFLLPSQILYFPGTNKTPIWSFYFIITMVLVITIFFTLPGWIYSFIIYKRFQNEETKRRWKRFIIGLLGVTSIYYLEIYEVSPVGKPIILEIVFAIYIFSAVIIWGYFLYQGLGRKI